MKRTEAMHVAGPAVTHTGAEPGNPYREIRRQRRALGPPFRVLVCVHELGGLNLHVFGNEASPCPGNAGGTDDQELAKTRAVARQLHDMPCPLRVDRVQIGQRSGEARVRGGVNDDIDVLSQAIRHIGIEHHPLATNVPIDGNHATFWAMRPAPIGPLNDATQGVVQARAGIALRGWPHQDEHALERFVLQQLLQEMRPDRAGSPGQQNRLTHVSAPEEDRTSSIQSRR